MSDLDGLRAYLKLNAKPRLRQKNGWWTCDQIWPNYGHGSGKTPGEAYRCMKLRQKMARHHDRVYL